LWVVLAHRIEARLQRGCYTKRIPGRCASLFISHVFETSRTRGRTFQGGLELPKDISLLAFDDSAWFTALRPFVSTVRQPADDFADLAWAMLMARLNNDRSPALQSEVHADLVVRDSTIPYLGPLVTEAVQ
jgi:Periplasmic binding protein-like domain